jgi:DNA/RNA-binding domain of Phe-tRNA-synthetase-like protein
MCAPAWLPERRNLFMPDLGFQYHPDILARFPSICGGVILAHDLINSPTPPELLDQFLAEQRAILERLGQAPLSELPSLAAWRAAFRQFGVDPTKYRNAAEALLRRLTKKGDIPSISALVDLCNLVSIRYALPVAAFDARALSGPITVQFAAGSESFTAHDSPESERPEPGEVIFVDPAGLVAARRWCWKQSAGSTVGQETHAAVITIEAHHPGGEADVRAALADLSDLLSKYVSEKFSTGVLDANHAVLVEN